MRVVMDVLGHTRKPTSDLCTHVLHEVRVDAAPRMDTFVRGAALRPDLRDRVLAEAVAL